MGQNLAMAFAVMFSFGVGTASVLLAAGLVSTRLLSRTRAGVAAGASRGKRFLGALLLVLGIAVMTGLDKVAETWTVRWMPSWAYAI